MVEAENIPARRAIADQPWPAENLETLLRCPVCGSPERTTELSDIWDATFFVAPGRWTLRRCGACRSGYLDPRPTEESIGRAYETYYTHLETEPDTREKGRWERVRAALGNDYRRRRYGAAVDHALPFGHLLLAMAPPMSRIIDKQFRYLADLPQRRQPFVLDIGCGGGEWIRYVRAWGWNAVGADPDPAARKLGASKGLDIREGGAEAWLDHAGKFDAVTLNHVIEHLHRPCETLAQAFELLKPGGRLYIETPNMDALSFKEYGAHWRGLEAPRHLVLFNRQSLLNALSAAGFVSPHFHRQPGIYDGLRLASEKIASGLSPYDERSVVPPRPRAIERIREKITRSSIEYLTITCTKV